MPVLKAQRKPVNLFQCILGADGKARFFDINARLGGGAPLSIYAGADFLCWTIEERLGRRPSVGNPPFRPAALMLRFDDAVFIDDGGRLL